MTTSVTLTTTGTNSWTLPAGVVAGTPITVECIGGGAGGSAGNGFHGAGGGGGAYATSYPSNGAYIVTPQDAINGFIPYTIGAGSAGVGAVNASAGGNTSFSTNNYNLHLNSTFSALVGGLPATWTTFQSGTGLTLTIVGFGSTPSGAPTMTFRVNGTASAGDYFSLAGSTGGTLNATEYTVSAYFALTAGSTTNLSSMTWTADDDGTQIGTVDLMGMTSTLTQYSWTGTTTSTGFDGPYWDMTATGAVDITVTISMPQVEPGASATYWRSTPGYTMAVGGSAAVGTAGGIGGLATACVASGYSENGGNGATANAAGSGGGSGGGTAGAGGNGTIAGVGGTSASGISGGAVSATSPGNAGGDGSPDFGGGGGGGCSKNTSPSIGGAGGLGGGGGGSSRFSTGTGGAGGNGVIQLTFDTVISGSISATTKKPTASFTGTLTDHYSGSITATTKKPTASFHGAIGNRGSITATTKKPVANFNGTLNQGGSIRATTKKPIASFSGTVTNHYIGSISAITKKPVASFSGNVTQAPPPYKFTLPSPPQFADGDYVNAYMALLPTGRLWDRSPDSPMVQALSTLTPTYARLSDAAGGLLVDAFPLFPVNLLGEWQKTLGLPDACSINANLSLLQQQQQVTSRFIGAGGQSIPFIIQYAANLGYNISIQEFFPFKANLGKANQKVLGANAVFAWLVTLPPTSLQYFQAGFSKANSKLIIADDSIIQCELARISPAHCTLLFSVSG